jgi:TRAP-type C4-dicarboxylate transport system permease large subunit
MRIFRAAIPYFWALVLVLIAITYIPALTMFLPQLVYGSK